MKQHWPLKAAVLANLVALVAMLKANGRLVYCFAAVVVVLFLANVITLLLRSE